MFVDIPTDIIYYLSWFLPFKDLIRFLRSSSHLYKRLYNNEDFWKSKCGLITKTKDQIWINVYVSIQINAALFLFGDNRYGQLGNSHGYSTRPIKFPNFKFKDIAISHHTIAVDFDNTVWGWGSSKHGQLGISVNKDHVEPFRLGLKALQISVNYKNTGIIDMDNNVWLYGDSSCGRLGIRNTYNKFQFPKLKAKRISVGYEHIVILDLNNNVWTCGNNKNGQLGLDKSQWYSDLEIIPAIKAKQISAGGYHTVIIDLNDNVWTCGWNNNGQLGVGDTKDRNFPIEIGIKAKCISAGIIHTGIIDMDDSVWVCGHGEYGKLGLGRDVTFVKVLTRIPNLKAKQLALGNNSTLIIDLDNNVLMCGYGTGQLGLGMRENKLLPNKIPNTKAVKIAVGGDNSTALISLI